MGRRVRPVVIELERLGGTLSVDEIDKLDTRITKHGEEIDDHEKRIVRLEQDSLYYKEQQNRMLDSVANLSGKIDSLSIQIVNAYHKTDEEKAKAYDSLKAVIISQIVCLVFLIIAVFFGLK